MSLKRRHAPAQHVFGLSDWLDWLGTITGQLFGLSAAEFEAAFKRGEMKSPVAQDLGSVLPLIDRLRAHSSDPAT